MMLQKIVLFACIKEHEQNIAILGTFIVLCFCIYKYNIENCVHAFGLL